MTSSKSSCFITNLPPEITEDNLKNFIIKFGFSVNKITLYKGKQRANVTFSTEKECFNACKAINRQILLEYKLGTTLKEKIPKIKLTPPQYEIFQKRQKSIEEKYKIKIGIDIAKKDKVIRIDVENEDIESETILKEIQTSLAPFSHFITCQIPQEKLGELDTWVSKEPSSRSYHKNDKKSIDTYNVYGNQEFLEQVKEYVGNYDKNEQSTYYTSFSVKYGGYFRNHFTELKSKLKSKNDQLDITFEVSRSEELFFDISSDDIKLNEEIQKDFENILIFKSITFDMKDYGFINDSLEFFKGEVEKKGLQLIKLKDSLLVLGLKSLENDVGEAVSSIQKTIDERETMSNYHSKKENYPFLKQFLCGNDKNGVVQFLSFLKITFTNYQIDTTLTFNYSENEFIIRVKGRRKYCMEFLSLLHNLETKNLIHNEEIHLDVTPESAKYIVTKIKNIKVNYIKIIVSEPLFKSKTSVDVVVNIVGLIQDQDEYKKYKQMIMDYEKYAASRLEFPIKRLQEAIKALEQIKTNQYIEDYFIPHHKNYVFINSKTRENLEKAEKAFSKGINPEKLITLNIEIPSFLKDKFTINDLSKIFKNVRLDYKGRENTLSINGMESEVRNAHGEIKERILDLENKKEPSTYYAMDPKFSYLLTHAKKDEYKQIISDTKVQIQGLLGTPYKVACTQKFGSKILVELMVGDISRTNMEYLICPIDSNFSHDVGLSELVVKRSEKIVIDKNKVDKEKIYITSGEQLKCKKVVFFPCTDIKEDGEYIKKIIDLFDQLKVEMKKIMETKVIKSIAIPSFCEKYPRREIIKILPVIYQQIENLCKKDVLTIEKVLLITNEPLVCQEWEKIVQKDKNFSKSLEYNKIINYPLKQRVENDRYWFFKKKDTWFRFPPLVMNEIQASYEKNEFNCDITMDLINYKVYFKDYSDKVKFEMKNLSTNETFKILNENPFWFYQDKEGWKRFSPSLKNTLQAEYEANEKVFEIYLDGRKKEIDIDELTMTDIHENNKTDSSEKIKISILDPKDTLNNSKIEVLSDPTFSLFDIEIKGEQCQKALKSLDNLCESLKIEKFVSVSFPPKEFIIQAKSLYNVDITTVGDEVKLRGFDDAVKGVAIILLEKEHEKTESNELEEFLKGIECSKLLKVLKENGLTRSYFYFFNDQLQDLLNENSKEEIKFKYKIDSNLKNILAQMDPALKEMFSKVVLFTNPRKKKSNFIFPKLYTFLAYLGIPEYYHYFSKLGIRETKDLLEDKEESVEKILQNINFKNDNHRILFLKALDEIKNMQNSDSETKKGSLTDFEDLMNPFK